MNVRVKKKTDRDLIAEIRALKDHTEKQSNLIRVAAGDATRSYAYSIALAGMAAAAHTLLRARLPEAADHVLTAIQCIETHMLRDAAGTGRVVQSEPKEAK